MLPEKIKSQAEIKRKMKIDARGKNEYLLTGELTFNTVVEVWKRSAELFAGGGPLIVDCAGITRSDSSALALFLEWNRLAQQQRRTINYRNLPPSLIAVAAVSGGANLFNLTTD